MRNAVRLCALVSLASLVATGCGKKSSSSEDSSYKDIAKTFDDSEPPPEKRQPVGDADLSKLSEADKTRFERLVDNLPSPCGKAHSLRTSRNNDESCVKARFAIDFVLSLLADGANDDELQKMFAQRYQSEDPRRGFRLDDSVPHSGPGDAQVVLVEFFDFGCPACKEFDPELKETLAAFPRDVVLYYKQYPLPIHEESMGAAQAALAAHKQGKYHEMHGLLFENGHAHKKSDLDKYAGQLGLDMAKFEADYKAVEPQVNADKKEGETAEVHSTPTLFINGVRYDGPGWSKYLKMWIEEALAVSR